MEILLKNCRYVVTQDEKRRILKNKDVFISNGVISEIGEKLDKSGEVINCEKKVVIPSLFNAHNHVPMSLLRGYRDDQDLHSWLNDVWKVEAKMKPEHMYVGALYSLMEMVKTGTYAFVDMYFNEDTIAKAVDDIGLVGFLSTEWMDFFKEEEREKAIEIRKKFMKEIKGKYKNVEPILSVHSIYTNSSELIEWVRDYSDKHNVIRSIHSSETRKEVFDCVKKCGMRPVEYLDSMGFLDEKTVLFHASWVTKKEIEIIGKRKTSVVSCPSSNMKLATGGAFPLREYKENGVRIMIGTDGPASNNSLDMFREMRIFALLQKWFRWNGTEATAQEVLDYATRIPAEVFRLNSGSIEVGKEANITILDLNHHSMRPERNVISNLVYSATGDAVTDLIVRGEPVVRDKKLVKMEEEDIIYMFERTVEELMGDEL